MNRIDRGVGRIQQTIGPLDLGIPATRMELDAHADAAERWLRDTFVSAVATLVFGATFGPRLAVVVLMDDVGVVEGEPARHDDENECDRARDESSAAQSTR